MFMGAAQYDIVPLMQFWHCVLLASLVCVQDSAAGVDFLE